MSTNSTITTQKKVEVTITLPTININQVLEKVKKLYSKLFSSVYTPINNGASGSSDIQTARSRRMKFPRMGRGGFRFEKKYFKFIIPVIIAIVLISAIIGIIRSLPDAQSKPADSSSLKAPDVLSVINLDRKFSFPLKDDKGTVVGNFDYVIQSAAIQKQIIVQGQKATAVNGREFLILNLKITNNLKKTIQLQTRDYLRLTVASNPSEQLAPDIHNDPVEVQAISTKFTRVAIALDQSDTRKTINLKVGEIDSTKQNIDLNFKF
jgi:hypothetical protein